MAPADRQGWLFPLAPGMFDGIRLDRLDPSDEDDRTILIRSEHPEFDDAFEQEDVATGSPGETMNPRLHVVLHEAVANQIWHDDPPEVWQTAQRLTAAGYERHEVLHMLASVLVEEIWSVQHDGAPYDRDRYLAALEELPASWKAEREDDLDDELEELADAALEVLGELGPLAPEMLGSHLPDGGADVDLVLIDPRIVELGDGRLASVPALFAGTTITHRMTEEEAGGTTVALGVDLALLSRLLCGDHLHLANGTATLSAGSDDAVLEGEEGWLGSPEAGELAGFQVWPDGTVEVVAEPGPVIVADTLAAQLRSSFDRFGEGDGMPVEIGELLSQLAVDAPALVGGVLAPIGEVLERAGFEVRFGHAAPGGTDWDAFSRLRQIALVAAAHDLTSDEGQALVMVSEFARQFRLRDLGEPNRELADEVALMFDLPEFAEAFAEANEEHPTETRAFLATVRRHASRRSQAGLAWAESLVAGRAGEPEGAEECLRAALVLDPEYPPALADAAWYASDRGDAARAVGYLDRLEDYHDDPRTVLLRRYVAPVPVTAGRNDPCPCGSGRKYKQCCLRTGDLSGSRPLPERVRWVWEKLRWWLERDGREVDAFDIALALQGEAAEADDSDAFFVNVDIAASLVLFADGGIEEFLRQRGSLLPNDECNMVTQWALTAPSVYEVTSVRVGAGMSIRDLRTGDIVDVTERLGSTEVANGDLLLAHPVFDGEGYQFVGGIVPVPLSIRDAIMDVLDENGGGAEIAAVIGAARRRPELVNMEGEKMVACEATYRVPTSRPITAQLDATFESGPDGVWEEWVEVDGRRWLRSQVTLDGDMLRLSANSVQRYERLRDAVSKAVPGLELINEERTSAADAARASFSEPTTSLPPESGGEVDPEVADALAALIREQEVRWVDEPIPALAGLTPRQAANDPTRREDLIALLHEFDRRRVPAGAVTFDTDRLRALLQLRDE
jgi:tetratricopeptide (TPR) repeat protein